MEVSDSGDHKGRRLALREQVYRQLKDDILMGVLRTGTRLRETELSDSYGVSRTPVREALQRLHSEGLVTRVGRAQLAVLKLSDQDIDELFELRLALETQAADGAARHVTNQQLFELEEVLARTEAAIGSGDVATLIRLNERFHLAIAEASSNRRMLETLQGIHSTLNVFRRSLFTDSAEIQSSTLGHRFLLQALRAAKEGLIGPETFAHVVADHVREASSSFRLRRLRGDGSVNQREA